METWAHTQDIADALGVSREPTGRLRHVAHIGVGARAYSFAVNARPAPSAPVRVELIPPSAPAGVTWAWGPEDAADLVAGQALDFCLLVTQRRHRDDVDLTIEGPAAGEWMAIAQAFAGAAGPGRKAAREERLDGPAQHGAAAGPHRELRRIRDGPMRKPRGSVIPAFPARSDSWRLRISM